MLFITSALRCTVYSYHDPNPNSDLKGVTYKSATHSPRLSHEIVQNFMASVAVYYVSTQYQVLYSNLRP